MKRMREYLDQNCSDLNWLMVNPPGLTKDPITDKKFIFEEGDRIKVWFFLKFFVNMSHYFWDIILMSWFVKWVRNQNDTLVVRVNPRQTLNRPFLDG